MTVKSHSFPLRYRHHHYSSYTDTRFPEFKFVHADIDRELTFCGGLDVKTVSVNSGWRDKIAAHLDATSGYFRKTGTMERASCSCSGKKPGPGTPPQYYVVSKTNYTGCPETPSSFPQSTDAALVDMAVKRLKNKLATAQGDFRGLAPLAELKEMRGLISQTANLTETLLRELIDIKRTRGRSAVKYASKAWLTYGFGVAPLISDTKAAGKSISDYLLRQDRTVVVRGKSSSTTFSGSRGVASGDANAALEHHTHITHKLSYECVAGIHLAMGAGNDYGALDHFHLNARSLPSVGWELTPFSWVVDYFTTAGEFLEDAFEANPPGTFYVSLSRKYTAIGQFSVEFQKPAPPNLDKIEVSGGSGNGLWTYTEFERTALPSIPSRALRVKTLDEIGLNGITKVLNLASILGSSIKRNKPAPRYTE